jgi:glycosyltransferase involved in cell wall biosynthesis
LRLRKPRRLIYEAASGGVLVTTTAMVDPHDHAAPRWSVALCTYNGARFVREQLDSITAQSVKPHEIVVCDDQSTDDTARIVREFAASSPIRLSLEVNPTRLGVTKNFERAIARCTGEIIFLCDQDDMWRADKIERLSRCFDDPAVGLAFSNAQVVNEDLSSAGYDLWPEIWFGRGEQERVRNGDALPVLLRHAIAAGTTLAFRASYRELILPIPDLPHSHDVWITLLIACAGGRLCPVDETLVKYRLHGGNVVGMKKHPLLNQIRMARWQVSSGAFRYLAELHQSALDRLVERGVEHPQVDYVKRLLAEKSAHSRVRDEMPRTWFRRWPIVARELRAGNYRRYSYGWKSVLQDLFLR